MKKELNILTQYKDKILSSKEIILDLWFSFEAPQNILRTHNIDINEFKYGSASSVFDYFLSIISKEQEIGNCPTIQNLLIYLKDKDIKADELFDICSHFRMAIIEFIYQNNLCSREIIDEILYMFDKNFGGVLRFYTDSIYQKELEINRHVRLLNEYQNALDESAIISKMDERGIVRYINDKYLRLSGYTKDEIIGKEYLSFMHEDVPDELFNDMWFQLQNAGVFRGTLKMRKKSGEYYFVDITMVKIVDPHSNHTECMSIATDVTTLIDARLEAQRASQAKEYFLSNMSHEIRTPLNAILGFVNLLIEQDLSKQHRKYLEIILNSGENLLSIINDILDFSKLRSGEFMVEPKVFSIHNEISHTLELFVASANVKNITITSFINPTIPRELFADALRIKQILSNFLSNAIKFTRPNGHIHVEASCKDKVLTISVSDNGVGIKQSDLKIIFSAFTQSTHEDIDKLQGTGLGLSICYQLARLMGGDIFVESSVGVGSNFWVELPVEVHKESCGIFSDMEDFKRLDIAVYKKDSRFDYKIDSFLRYAEVFGIDLSMIDSIKNPHSVVIILEDDIDEQIKDFMISSSDTKYVILTSRPTEYYEKYTHISCVCFPMYCSKIKSTLSELLYPDTHLEIKKLQKNKKYKGHILVAEDNEANQELIKVLLSKYGLTYDIASNGLEAFELFSKRYYDLILMDEQMPVMDGNEAIRHILSYEREKKIRHTPISALTANVIKGSKERGLRSGFDSFLGKPIIIKELERVFDTYLKHTVTKDSEDNFDNYDKAVLVEGLNLEELMKELMLSEEELTMLLNLFISKISKLLPELHDAIVAKDYKKIASLAHNIKGSSANFRIEDVQKEAAKMEKMARDENIDFNFKHSFYFLQNRLQSIKIASV